MDDRTYRRIFLSCPCGKTFRSMAAEAMHRHNFPALCRPEPQRVKTVADLRFMKPRRGGSNAPQNR